jgi:ATP-binding cassette, subfamily F, member 3
MIRIRLSNVKLVLGASTIFQDLSWEIQDSQVIGLIGPNGAGKSSLLKLITGDLSPEPGGTLTRAKGVTVGYLPQEPDFDPGMTALSIALAGNPRIPELESALEQVEANLGEPHVYNNPKQLQRALSLQERYLEEYLSLGGEGYPQRVRDMLKGLGLEEVDFDKPSAALSGGQKKLVGLARLLLAQPDVLLLDEPDNHLDLSGKAYLERLVKEYPGPLVIISHDRYLLDAVVTHIAELEDGRLSLFQGDYSSYIVDKDLRLARQEELYRVQQREIQRLEVVIKRYAMWGKVYDNEDFARRAKTIQGRLDRMEKIGRPILERKRMGLQLNGWRGSNKVLEVSRLRKSFSNRYVQNAVLEELDLLIWHGERVGLMGPNGAGKSVLLRLVLGIEQPDGGEIILGPSVKIGYYSQEHETLDFEMTPLEAVRYAGAMSESNAVAFLMRYLFTYRQVSQKIGELSGGERSRLQLALLVLSGANFLLLDEPTNNLDIASAEVLENALQDFEGSVLVISHDRYFLDRTVQRLLVLEQGRLSEYHGGYSEYAAAGFESK